MDLVAFLGIAVLVIVVPGPDTALTVRNTLAGGRRDGVFTALGITAALSAWAIAASVGLAALLVASEPAFVALKLCGAAYLVFLGAQALRAALRGRVTRADAPPRRGGPRSPWPAFRQGVLSNLGNPKIAVFFTSLLPQFGSSFASLLALGLLFAALGAVWLSAYAVVVARAGDLLRRPAVGRALDAVTGVVLVGFGLRLAVSGRS